MRYKITPQPGHMVVEPIKSAELNKSELAEVEDGKERICTGKAIKVSKFAGTFENFGFQVPTEVQEGDIVAYAQYSEHPLKINGIDYHIVRFDKIIAVISEQK